MCDALGDSDLNGARLGTWGKGNLRARSENIEEFYLKIPLRTSISHSNLEDLPIRGFSDVGLGIGNHSDKISRCGWRTYGGSFRKSLNTIQIYYNATSKAMNSRTVCSLAEMIIFWTISKDFTKCSCSAKILNVNVTCHAV